MAAETAEPSPTGRVRDRTRTIIDTENIERDPR